MTATALRRRDAPADATTRLCPGETHVSARAIMRIAERAVRDVPHVRLARASGAGGLARRLRREPGVDATVETGDGWAQVRLALVVDWPCRIRDVANDAAETVARRLADLTGVSVDTVDVHIESLHAGDEPRRRVR